MAKQKIAMGINLRMNKNERNAGYGKYYPVVDRQATLSLRGFCDHMVTHGSVYKRNVIEGVLKEIIDHLPELVAQGVPVQLDGLGIFYPTAQVVKGAAVESIAAMDGLNPNTIVQGIHLRFKPDATKLDNLSGPAFKDACSLELRNIVDTEAVTVNGKTRKVQTLVPIESAVAKYKAEHPELYTNTAGNDSSNSGGSNGSSQNGGSQSGTQSGGNNGGSSQGGSSTGSETNGTPVLTISKTGNGSASVTAGGNMVNSGASIAEDTQVTITITPATGMTPSATINGNNVSLTEDSGTYSGSFAMPGTNATLMINTGSSGDGDTN